MRRGPARLNIDSRSGIEWLAAAAIMAAAPCAFGVEYFTLGQVQAALFPAAAQFDALDVSLSGPQMQAVKRQTGVAVRDPKLHVWQARSASGEVLGFLLLDAVYGKHELINYAVALNPGGSVLAVEIMTYNETYGGEIRDAAWRAQFVGKKMGDALKVHEDIRNIGGATLSCVHVTEGIRRLLAEFSAALPAHG